MKNIFIMNNGTFGKEQIKHLGKKSVHLIWPIIRAILVAGICFVILSPLITKITISFMSEKDLYNSTVKYVPENWTLDNYKIVFRVMEYPLTLLKSVFLAFSISICQVISCCLVAYGLARFKFPGKKLLMFLLVVTLVVPPQTIIVPLFLNFRWFDPLGLFGLLGIGSANLIDTYWPFVLMSLTGTYLKNALYIFILSQVFKSAPKAIEDSACVDGAGVFKTFYKIMIPNVTPMLLTVFLFSFVWQWTDIFYTSMFLNQNNVLANALIYLPFNVLTIEGTTSFVSSYNLSYISMIQSTGSILIVAPLLLFYAFTQRFFLESLNSAAVKG